MRADPELAIFETRSIPSSTVLGILHFSSGCDDLSFLCGFSKRFCFRVFERHCNKICPEDAAGVDKILSGDEAVEGVFAFAFWRIFMGTSFPRLSSVEK